MAEGNVASNGQKRVQLPQPGIILYPALGNPELVSGEETVHLVVTLTAKPAEMAGDAGKMVIARHLKFLTLSDTEAFKLRALNPAGLHPALPASMVVEVESLAGFAAASPPVVKSDKKRFYGIFRETIVKYFAKGDLHGYSDESVKKAKPENAYHVTLNGPELRTWLRKSGGDPDLAHHCYANWVRDPDSETGRDGGAAPRELEEAAVTNALRGIRIDGRNKFVGPRLRNASDAVVDSHDPLLMGDEGPLRVFDIFKWEFGLAHPFATLHPIFFYEKEQCLSVGFVSDLHVVSRLEVMRRSDFHLVPGADAKESPRVAGQISTTAQAVRDLISKASADGGSAAVDVMVLGGDLIDFAMGSFPAIRLPESVPAETLRGYVNADSANVDNLYNHGVDFMAIYQLVVEFYRVGRKPVVILAGNHDAYDLPFGISPRVIGQKYKLGNPGIPSDANLTIMEACLLYGDRYDLVMEGFNFKPQVMDCYYLLFTPVFSFTSKMGKMQWISLGWGDKEDMLWDGPGLTPGHLPNAEMAVSDAELPLIQYGADNAAKHGQKCLMVSHYTWACYSDFVLQDGKAVNFFPWGDRDNTTDFNLGSCELNRQKVYEMMFGGRIHYAVSGHAHRSGVYAINMLHHVSDRVSVTGYPLDRFPDCKAQHKAPYLIVSDSAGPVPRENVAGEFNGLGSNKPSFTKLLFSAAGDLTSVVRVQSTLPTAKPRLAVTMDYCEMEAGGTFWLKKFGSRKGLPRGQILTMQSRFECDIPVHIPVTALEHVPDWVGLVSGSLHIVINDAMRHFTLKHDAAKGWVIRDDDYQLLLRNKDFSGKGFLTIHLGIFPEKAYNSTSSRYDTSSPWVVVVKVKITAAAVGYVYDTDFKIEIERDWDYVKYATQAKYKALQPSPAKPAPKEKPAPPKPGSSGPKDGLLPDNKDPSYQFSFPLPF